jgi:5-formyltetrahydrofolate cyclo-ligase
VLFQVAWRAAKTLVLPQSNPATGSYAAAVVRDRESLRVGRFGVLEPAAGCPVLPLNQLDLVLVPGVAFDLSGGRLGRGMGFYDRLLAEVRGHKCGVAYDLQIVPSVPVERHDVRVDSILTPTRWHRCGVAG